MKLYWTSATGNWTGTQADARRDAGRKLRVDQVEVPTDKPGLLAWLNERRVRARQLPTAIAEQAGESAQLASDGDRPWIAGSPTKDPPRVAPADFRLADGKTDFIPVTRAALLDLHFERCPSCHRDAAAALQAEHVIAWVRGSASLDDLQLAAEAIRAQVSELGEQLGDRSVQ